MSLKSRIGPLALEAPLGKSTASGQVFRAIHVEQRKLLAVRVFPVALGLTPESRRDYASQLDQLKQLKHRHIARCYGGGFDARNAYLVYELVDGESLDKVIARRGRLSWETAFEYGQQMADALQYAHLMGWVHGRIRPEKVLLLADGTGIKVTDFRRDAIATAIGGGPPQLDDLLFAAPEQCACNIAPNEKCDLYSLGAVLFAMMVGEPPIPAKEFSELVSKLNHSNAPTVQSRVLDCPIWLSALVEQLLAKDPNQRPYSAAAVQLAFKEAQRRETQGVGVLQHATGGFSPLRLKTNREEAEKVLGLKPHKQRARDETPLWERAWVLVLALVLCVGATVWFMLPLGRSTLRVRAEALLASEEFDDWDTARELYLNDLLERFPETEEAIWAQEKIDLIESVSAERRLERLARLGRTPEREIESNYLEALRFEQFGDISTALTLYRGSVKLPADDPSDRPVVVLIERRIKELESRPESIDNLKRFLGRKLEEANKLYSDGKVRLARTVWESIIRLYGENRDAASAVAIAQEKLKQ